MFSYLLFNKGSYKYSHLWKKIMVSINFLPDRNLIIMHCTMVTAVLCFIQIVCWSNLHCQHCLCCLKVLAHCTLYQARSKDLKRGGEHTKKKWRRKKKMLTYYIYKRFFLLIFYDLFRKKLCLKLL